MCFTSLMRSYSVIAEYQQLLAHLINCAARSNSPVTREWSLGMLIEQSCAVLSITLHVLQLALTQ